ncbi:MAG: polysaccharide deacetylase family protein [Bacteroidia bacterium]|nr:polysaccharide deacetylase family protein [Bacteroidia bacterium]MDG2042908.1 polysaccharide deacetylase family protein [Bacteroidia bacterium]
MNFWKSIGSFFLPQLTWTREVADKEVFLTFDDGPHPEITPWVVNELDKVGAKATFFVVGENAQRYFTLVDKMQKSGHRVGNHTHRHIKGWHVSSNVYLEDIANCENYLTENTIFRPPYGQINFASIPAIRKKYEVIMWDVLSKDYLKRLNVKRALKRIKKATKPGSIIVFHDSVKAETNLKAMLPNYLKFLEEEGYKMSVL